MQSPGLHRSSLTHPSTACVLAIPAAPYNLRWEANAAPILEFFSSLGLMYEVIIAPSPPACGLLCTIGYLAQPQPRNWLRTAGWCTAEGRLAVASGLQVLPIAPVFSRRLIVDPSERAAVLRAAADSCGLPGLADGTFKPAVPTRRIGSVLDAEWVAAPGRYLMSRKADGTRYLLIVGPDGVPHLLNRAGMLYRFPIATSIACSSTASSSTAAPTSQQPRASHECSGGPNVPAAAQPPPSRLPPGTILDGELLWIGPHGARRGFFLVFDALAVGSTRTWHLPLADRLHALEKLRLGEAEGSQALHAAAARAAVENPVVDTTVVNPRTNGPHSGAKVAWLSLATKQQAPLHGEDDTILLLTKRHWPVTPKSLQHLEGTGPDCPFPTDGLIFSPLACPYALGTAELLLRWQVAHQAAADLAGAQLQQRISDVDSRTAAQYFNRVCGMGRLHSKLPGMRKNQRNTSYYLQPGKARSAVRGLMQDLPTALVYECLPTSIPEPACPLAAAQPGHPHQEVARGGGHLSRQSEGSQRETSSIRLNSDRRLWVPTAVRWDKWCGNAESVVADLEECAAQGRWMTHQQLVKAVKRMQTCGVGPDAATAALPQAAAVAPADVAPARQAAVAALATAEAAATTTTGAAAAAAETGAERGQDGARGTGGIHLARIMTFDQLYSEVMAEVEFGNVEHCIDSQTGLEIFCYKIADDDRGCPTTSTAGDGDSDSTGGGCDVQRSSIANMCRGLILHPASRAVVAMPFVGFGEVGAESVAGAGGLSSSYGGCARAALKVDGSLVIAFVWEGQLRTATRRRMDSEQVGPTVSSYMWLVQLALSSHARMHVCLPVHLPACLPVHVLCVYVSFMRQLLPSFFLSAPCLPIRASHKQHKAHPHI